jgi:LemA protein
MSVTAIAAIIIVVAAVIFLWGISAYNRIARLSSLKDEAWGGLDAQLRRRFDLIPNLVGTVKGFAKHEREILERVTAAQSAVSEAATPSARIEAENALSGTLKTLFAAAEAYPGLKANADYIELRRELSSIECEIQMARSYYNGSASDYNISVTSFPATLISRGLGYGEAAVFDAGEIPLESAEVSFV